MKSVDKFIFHFHFYVNKGTLLLWFPSNLTNNKEIIYSTYFPSSFSLNIWYIFFSLFNCFLFYLWLLIVRPFFDIIKRFKRNIFELIFRTFFSFTCFYTSSLFIWLKIYHFSCSVIHLIRYGNSYSKCLNLARVYICNCKIGLLIFSPHYIISNYFL